MKNTITYRSIYQSCLEDEIVEVVSVKDGLELEPGKIVISDILQKTLYQVKQKYGYGIVMLQEGEYYIDKTIYIPRGIRLFGFGLKRPKITLIKNAEGFGSDSGHTIKNAKYMFWFTANMPEKEEEAEDANPGTFYSALSNIDFAIESDNSNAVVIRAHFAQNCYVSYCHFEIGDGLAGIHSVGNEMEQLSFSGGDWGIYTGKCSPGWPFVLTDNSKQTVGDWQLANLWIEDTETHIHMPDRPWEPKAILENMDSIDSMCSDGNGNLYICDSRLKRVYKWDQKSAKIELLLSTHYRPLSLACDTLGNLLMVIEYKPVKYAKKDGVLELDIQEYGERSREDFGACFYAFFRKDRRIRVLSLNTEKGESSFCELEPKLRSEASLKRLYYPVNQWRDNGDMKTVIQLPDETCYIAPDGITGITNNPALARATGLCAVQKNEFFYAVDEYNKYVLKLKVDQNLDLQDPAIVAYRGEYSAIASDNGELYVSDNLLYCYMGEQVRTIALAKRPACMIWKDKEYKYLCISARTSLYVMKVKE